MELPAPASGVTGPKAGVTGPTKLLGGPYLSFSQHSFEN